ncbi:MAG: hypothetical protein U0930_23340 [Pirellulales bacterium]
MTVDPRETIYSLTELVQKLNSMAEKEVSQSTELQANQREIKALTPLKEAIESNLEKFESDWPTIGASLQRIRTSLRSELEELTKELQPATKAKIDSAIVGLSKKDSEAQASAKLLDASLNGEVTWKRIEAEKFEAFTKARLSEIHMASIAKRINSAEARLKKASSVASNNDSLRAEKYVLLGLVTEVLESSRIETDYLTYVSAFHFPTDKSDYEKKLLQAALDYANAQESLFQLRAAEEASKTDFKKTKTAVQVAVQSRMDRMVDTAKESVH